MPKWLGFIPLFGACVCIEMQLPGFWDIYDVALPLLAGQSLILFAWGEP